MAAEPWERFNTCEYLLDRHVEAGEGARLAITGIGGPLTYAQLLDRVQRTAAGLRDLGLQPEQRLVMFMADSPEFVAVYLAAMRIGAVPVPVSTMLHADGLAELLRDSRARMLAVTPQFFGLVAEAAAAARRDCRAFSQPAGPRRPRPRCRCRCRCTILTRCWRRRCRWRLFTRRPRTSRHSGFTPPAPPARARGRSTGTGRSGWPARLTAPRCWASGQRTAACRRPRRSSPTGLATRCCSRSRRGP